MRRAALILALSLAAALTSGCTAQEVRAWLDSQVKPAPQACQEDEPCWDCSTMGNRICGPVLAPSQYQR